MPLGRSAGLLTGGMGGGGCAAMKSGGELEPGGGGGRKEAALGGGLVLKLKPGKGLGEGGPAQRAMIQPPTPT